MSFVDRMLIGAVLLTAATPAFAGVVAAPGPEAGAGLAALAAAAVGYRYLRRRAGR